MISLFSHSVILHQIVRCSPPSLLPSRSFSHTLFSKQSTSFSTLSALSPAGLIFGSQYTLFGSSNVESSQSGKHGRSVCVAPIQDDVFATEKCTLFTNSTRASIMKVFLPGNNNDHVMISLEHAPHSVCCKGCTPHYVPAILAKFQPEMHEPMVKVVNNVAKIDGQTSIECLTLFQNLMLDVLVSVSYGYRIHAVKKWATTTAISDFPKCDILFVSECVYQARTEMKTGKLDESSEIVPLLHRLLKYRFSSTGQMTSDHNILSEAMGHMYVPFSSSEFSRRPDIAAKIQAELDEAMPNAHIIPDISMLPTLPYLNAFIKEGLRVYSAAPSPLEYVVPQSTSKTGEGFDLSCQLVPLLLLEFGPCITKQPGCAERLARMQQNMMPFDTGSRVCGGQNLAQIVLKVMGAAMARNFDISHQLTLTRGIWNLRAASSSLSQRFHQEGLQVYSPAPSPLECVVPQSTYKTGERFNSIGFELPAGTIVATQAWSMYRNQSIFFSPDTFSPECWLETAQPGCVECSARMQQNMMPFGTGSRVCGDQNLAQIMLKIMVAAMARDFEIVTPVETNEKSMKIKDSFSANLHSTLVPCTRLDVVLLFWVTSVRCFHSKSKSFMHSIAIAIYSTCYLICYVPLLYPVALDTLSYRPSSQIVIALLVPLHQTDTPKVDLFLLGRAFLL
ncbi:hypothetical protein GYMLUDRAFT_265313 [Collybiopsis luxurians FD-317 M1]|uniref:Unplaced genomic scaffold GYMLUscaffold_90, whole genome shotgun sequence n=1 Tax=Collybiopsis luxurians FD-317 M1 TaxID=944289 RepID=A0A0D0AQT3_9AGAR|nr:hypothetical protein GYMLUDRAFT_265313 [Collybiopsis luxurians FD-317 M1]